MMTHMASITFEVYSSVRILRFFAQNTSLFGLDLFATWYNTLSYHMSMLCAHGKAEYVINPKPEDTTYPLVNFHCQARTRARGKKKATQSVCGNCFRYRAMANSDMGEEMDATELVTTVICEQLQLSGEKDRLKNMLIEDLRTHGWTESMFKAAAKATALHRAENDAVVGTGPAKSTQSLTAFHLAHLITKPGHGMFI